MRVNKYYVFFVIVFLFCSKTSQNSNEPLRAELKLVSTFGAGKNLDENFLLGDPECINVNEMGDVYICDGAFVKIFDNSGKPKKILGGKGQGPGEYNRRPRNLNISPTGFLTVMNSWYSYKIYNSDNGLIDENSINSDFRYINFFEKTNFSLSMPIEIFTLNGKSKITHLRAVKIDPGDPFIYHRLLVYETPDSLHEIVRYKSKTQMHTGRRIYNFPFRGSLIFKVISENELIYIDPGHDVIKNGNNPEYVLHKFLLNTYNDQKISHPYKPVSPSDSMNALWGSIKDYPELKEHSHLTAFIEEIKEDSRYACPIHKILADNDKLYVFTFQQNENREYLTDIFNSKTMEYIKSVYIRLSDYIVYNKRVPFDQSVIKNGYVYMFSQNEEDEPVIKKYRIDPE